MERLFKVSDINNFDNLEIYKAEKEKDIYISVIIPCYNVEKYIDRCLNSLVNQTIGLEHLQIIVINDASPDGTLYKLMEWREKFLEDITVITYKENLRQGGARNLGIQCACGEYIGFMDSDDWIELDMYESLYEKAKEKNCDAVRGKFIRDASLEAGDKIITEKQEDEYYEFEQINGFYVNTVENKGINGIFGSICTGIYRKELIIENDVWFPEEITYEDNYWSSIINLYIKDLYIIDRVFYHYFLNMNSTVTTKNSTHHLDRLDIEIIKVEEYKKRGAFEPLYRKIEMEFINLFYLNTLHIIFTRFENLPDIWEFMREKTLYYFPDFINNPFIHNYIGFAQGLIGILYKRESMNNNEFEALREIYLKELDK